MAKCLVGATCVHENWLQDADIRCEVSFRDLGAFLASQGRVPCL